MKQWILKLAALLAVPAVTWAGVAEVESIHGWSDAGTTQVTFDLDALTEYRIFTLDKPHRVVIDLSNARAAQALSLAGLPLGPIHGMRSSLQKDNTLRVVLDVVHPVRPAGSWVTADNSARPRLVISVEGSPVRETAPVKTAVAPAPVMPKVETPAAAQPPASEAAAREPETPRDAARANAGRDIVVAVDAGHGGKDPGAIGNKGTREKDVTLAIARKLAARINQEPGMRAVLTRDSDEFIALKQRTHIARQHKADMFISIHADATRNGSANGASVFVLSERGATSEAAKWLADRENAADLVGGVSLDDKDNVLASVLLDLSQTASIEASMRVASNVLTRLGRIGDLHNEGVEQAGFMVLKSPDIPSILVETAFITNPAEERRLRDEDHQRKLADAVLTGVRDYFVLYPPPGTRLALADAHKAGASKRHVISSGETLSSIAQKYQVSIDRLKVVNTLGDGALRVGQVLQIPRRQDG